VGILEEEGRQRKERCVQEARLLTGNVPAQDCAGRKLGKGKFCKPGRKEAVANDFGEIRRKRSSESTGM